MRIPYDIHQIVDADRLPFEKAEEYELLALPTWVAKIVPKCLLRWKAKRKYNRYLAELEEIKLEMTRLRCNGQN